MQEQPIWLNNGATFEFAEELRTRGTDDDSATRLEKILWKLRVLQIDTSFIIEVDWFSGIGSTEEYKRFELKLSPGNFRPEAENVKLQWMLGNYQIGPGENVRIDGLPGSYSVAEETFEIAGLERECWYLKRALTRFTPKDTSTEFWFDKKLGILLNFVEITPKDYNSLELVNFKI